MAVNEHEDDLPDEAEARIARLYKEAAREEPPARLDRAVAASARERPAGTASAARTPWCLPWRVPFAFAAVAVVSVSLVTLMMEEDRERIMAVPQSAPAPTSPPSASEPVQERAGMPADPGAPAAPAKREPKAEQKAVLPPARADSVQGRASGEERDLAALQKRGNDERREASSSAELARAQKLPPAEPAREVARDAARDASPRARAEPQPFPAAERPATAPSSVPPPPAPGSGPSAPPASAPAAGAVLPPAPAAKPAPAPRAAIGIRGLEEPSTFGTLRPSPEVARHLVELDKQPPSAWIERMLALRKEGRAAEADGVLAEFKRRYPDAVLPPELR